MTDKRLPPVLSINKFTILKESVPVRTFSACNFVVTIVDTAGYDKSHTTEENGY